MDVSAGELLNQVQSVRATVREAGLRKGDRCALLAANSAGWAAFNLALMAEGVILVPFYTRQAASELAVMLKDCEPALICCGTAALGDTIRAAWTDAPTIFLLDESTSRKTSTENGEPASTSLESDPGTESDPVAIIYTSGTSGEAKGAILLAANVNFMLSQTTARLDVLMGQSGTLDRVFHYLPFCFAGSWILMLSCLVRTSVLTISTDLTTLADDIQKTGPHYFLNVPMLLDRMKSAVETKLRERGGFALSVFTKAMRPGTHLFWTALAKAMFGPRIRRSFGPNLKTLICGSAPLTVDTQQFFMMFGIPLLQVYGLTETCAICTMDEPDRVDPGYVGQAIDGVEITVSDEGELLVRGPNVFAGYWNRPEATAEVLRNGWFHTGDTGESNGRGNWRITGRLRNIIVLSSGHNIAPEPVEQKLLLSIPGAAQVVVVGHGRRSLCAIVSGAVAYEEADKAIKSLNTGQTHYKQIRGLHIAREPFTIENGLLTANGKLKRDAVSKRFQTEIEKLAR
jgi:long-chain acyl-CoA synthetase